MENNRFVRHKVGWEPPVNQSTTVRPYSVEETQPTMQPYIPEPDPTAQDYLNIFGQALGPVARFGENYLGSAGDMLKSILGAQVTGAQSQAERTYKMMLKQPDNTPERAQKLQQELAAIPDKYAKAKEPLEYIPSTSMLRDLTRKYTGEALEPSKEGVSGFVSNFLQDTAGDFGQFLAPIFNPVKSAKQLYQTGKKVAPLITGVNGLASIYKEVGKRSGYDPQGKGADIIKTAAFIGHPFIGLPKSLERVKNNIYALGKEEAAGGVLTGKNVEEFNSWVNNFWDTVTNKRSFQGDEEAIKLAQKLRNVVGNRELSVSDIIDPKTGKNILTQKPMEVSVENLWDLKKDINGLMGRFMEDKKGYALARSELHNLNDQTSRLLKSFKGKNGNFAELVTQGDELHKALNSSSWLGNALDKATNINKLKYNPFVYVMLGKMPFDPGAVAAGAAATYALKRAVKITDILKDSPEARAATGRIIMNAQKQNLPGTLKYVQKLSNEFDKYPETKQLDPNRFKRHKIGQEGY